MHRIFIDILLYIIYNSNNTTYNNIKRFVDRGKYDTFFFADRTIKYGRARIFVRGV
jgi:hypothetical protein